MSKKVLILSGSPRKGGNSDILCDEFMRGALEAGNTVEKIRIAEKKIGYCSACYYCAQSGGVCARKDDMAEVLQKMIDADVIVLSSPVYFYSIDAQLKTVIDRFCAFNSSLTSKQMKSALISAAWNDDDWTFEALETHYKTLVRYLHLEDCGSILGYGCGTVRMTESSEYPQLAYKLGKSI